MLDTAITPGLRRKGQVRHLVHQIQTLRKDAGLNVEDRIRVAVEAGDELGEAVDEHRSYVCAETLAVELSRRAAPDGWVAREVDVDEARVRIALARV